jgi:uncharacterized protein (TIGR02145 family)
MLTNYISMFLRSIFQIKFSIFIFFTCLFLFSCDKFEWYNPYDPQCPKSFFTPSGLSGEIIDRSLKISWLQENEYVSGFAIFRSSSRESITKIAEVAKNTSEYIDGNINAGTTYIYYVLALAGANQSDTIKFEITPIFPVVVTTGVVSGIAPTSAKVDGNVTDAGGTTVTSKGICWSTTPGPTINNSKVLAGTGMGVFTGVLSGLQPGIIYYVRAFGENSLGVSYGAQISFQTTGIPLISSTEISNITASGVVCTVNITNDGGAAISSRGICWSTSTNPTINDSKTIEGSGVGIFSSTISGLKPSTIYYLKAYATNIYGTIYGQELTFSTTTAPKFTAGEGVIDIDNNSYRTVIIGGVEWMAENLKVSKYNDGSLIYNANSLSDVQWSDLASSAVTDYNKIESNSSQFGKLYNWYAVNDSRKICPSGWHVATDAEWTELSNLAGGENIAGGKLKEIGVSNWSTPNVGATDEYTFKILPSGWRERFGYFGLGSLAMFWTGSVSSTMSFWRREVANSNTIIKRVSTSQDAGFSVRCVKDR